MGYLIHDALKCSFHFDIICFLYYVIIRIDINCVADYFKLGFTQKRKNSFHTIHSFIQEQIPCAFVCYWRDFSMSRIFIQYN